MPGKEGTVFHLTANPRGLGIKLYQIDAFIKRIKEQQPLRFCAVSEPNKRGGKHLHIVYELSPGINTPHNTDKQKKLFKTVAERFEDAEDYTFNYKSSLQVSAPPDFYRIAGGYHQKDSQAVVIESLNLDKDQLNVGNAEYGVLKKKSVIKSTTKSGLPTLYAEYHHKFMGENPDAHTDYKQMKIIKYKDCSATQQVDYVSRCIVRDGYTHLISDIGSPRFILPLLRFWNEITAQINKIDKDVEYFKNNFFDQSIKCPVPPAENFAETSAALLAAVVGDPLCPPQPPPAKANMRRS